MRTQRLGSFTYLPKTLAPIALAIGLLFWAGCKPPEDQGVKRGGNPVEGREPAEPRVFLTPITAIAVKRGELLSSVSTTGSVVPTRSRMMVTEEAGRLFFEKDWREGDLVEKDTLIARIDSETLVSEIGRSEADLQLQREGLDINRKSMNSAIREYEILQDLYSKGIAALKDVETTQLSMERAVNSFRQGQINLAKADQSLQSLKDRLERLEIRAPFEGLLVAANTLQGNKSFATAFGSETIADGQGKLVSSGFNVCGITDISSVILRCDVTSRDIERIRPEQAALATIYSTQDIAVEGRVLEISNAVNQDTRAFRVDILLPNPDRTLRPGMFARVDVVVDRRVEAVTIAKEHVLRRNGRDVVFIAEKSAEADYMIAREVPVVLGLESRTSIEVVEGLRENDILIVRGFEVLQDRSPITVIRADESIRPTLTTDDGATSSPEPTPPSGEVKS